jgi:hypothetical protein
MLLGWSCSSARAQRHGHRPEGDSLVQSTGAAHFRLILGRLSLDAPQHIKCRRACESECGQFQQTLRVTAERGIPSLHYFWSTPQREVTVDVDEAEHVRIRSRVRSGDAWETLHVDQPAWGPIEVHLDEPTAGQLDSRPWQVASLVHLRAEQPGIAARHLAPLWPQLLAERPPHCQADDLLAAISAHRADARCQRDHIEALVEQLAAPQRSRRAAAQRELLAIGLPVLAVVDRVNPRQLEAEQRGRLAAIRRQLRPTRTDSADSLAQWLSVDARYWKTIAPQLSPTQRRRADTLVADILGEELPAQYRVAGSAANSRR